MKDDNDLDLGLNLVFDAPSSTSSGGVSNNSNKKRKTKYDKRRERGRLAKLAKNNEGGVQRVADGCDVVAVTTTTTNSLVTTNRYDPSNRPPPLIPDDAMKTAASSLAGIAVALSSADVSSKSETLSKKPLMISATRPTTSVASKMKYNADTSSAVSSASSEITRGVSSKSSASTGSSSLPANNNEAKVCQTTPQPSPAALLSSSSSLSTLSSLSSRRRQHHVVQTAYTDEQRTAYLSEFHARPRDMDRNAHASREIKPSCISDHIFEQQNDVVDSGSTSSCPFSKLGLLHPRLVSALTSSNGPFKLVRPTNIQSHCLASLLTKNPSSLPATKSTEKKTTTTTTTTTTKKKKNLFIQSETGSGKTLAYLLPILQHLASSSSSSSSSSTDHNSNSKNSSRSDGTRCIILCPTRELSTQTYDTVTKLCQTAGYCSWIVPGCLSGGEKRKSEKARLRRGITILVATPGRLLDHLTKTESLVLALKKKTKNKNGNGGGLEWLVLDEADRLLDGGGLGGQVEQIIQRLRACCSYSSSSSNDGGTNDDEMWRNVLVSATITKELEGMAKRVLGVDDDGWMWARGHNNATPTDGQKGEIMSTTPAMMLNQQQLGKDQSDNNDVDLSSSTQHGASDDAANNTQELDNAAPRQLAQLYMIVSAKLRLSSLIAFLVARAAKGERTVVFLSTCDSVDYHHALFTSMTSILGDDDDDKNDTGKDSGIFGNACLIYKLHGDIPHNKRLSTIQSFNNTQQQQQQQSAILLATDVAARGLNFSSLDWIVQYDPPCETKDYVHRAGRSARAGQAGHALLFLLPSERQYIEVLELRGLREISPLSLSSTLSSAVTLCTGLTREGKTKVGNNNNTFASDGVKSEAFTFAIQNRLEQCVLQDDVNYKASIEKKFKGDPKQRGRKQQRKKDALVGPLLVGARKAFSAFVRAYPAKEKAVRHIFNARALHLGHIARSLALKETPKMVSKGNNSCHSSSSSINSVDNSGEGDTSTKKNSHDKLQSKLGSNSNKGEKRKSRLTFGDAPVEMDNNDAAIEDSEQDRYMSLLGHVMGGGVPQSSLSNKKSKHSGGHSGGYDTEKRMMKAAILMQSQEYM